MSIFRVMPVSAGFFLLAFPATALTLTFDDPPHKPFEPYKESGFIVEDGGYYIAADGALHFDIFGGPYADQRTITREDGGAFSVNSLDVTALYPTVDTGGFTGGWLNDILFKGFNGVTLVGQFEGSSQNGSNTIGFGDIFADITSFLISGFDPGNIEYEPDYNDVHFEIDNIDVTAFTNGFGPELNPTVVPLPAVVWMLLAGLGGLGILRLRRQS